MKVKNIVVLFLVVVGALFNTGCYLWQQAEPSEIAVQLRSGRIVDIADQTGGLFSDTDWNAEVVFVDVGTLTFPVEDPSILTSDNQQIGMLINIQVRRNQNKSSIESFITQWNDLLNNQRVIDTVSATAREGMKNGVINYTLSEILTERNSLADDIAASVEEDAVKYGIEIVNLTITDVSPSSEYLAVLEEKSLLKVQTEKELERQNLINQEAANAILQAEKDVEVKVAQLEKERAQTAVEVEVAERAGKVIAAQNQVYLDNPLAFELERIRLMQAYFSDKTTYFFIPQGTDLNAFFNGTGFPIPQ